MLENILTKYWFLIRKQVERKYWMHMICLLRFFLINQFCSGLFFNSHVPIVLMLTNVRMTYRRTSTNNPDVHLDSIHVYFLHHPSGLNQSAVATKGDLIDSVPQIMHMIDVRRV